MHQTNFSYKNDGGTQMPPVFQTMNKNIAEVAGPLLLAHLANWGAQGILCHQVYKYYQAFPRDRAFLKVLVYGIFIIEVAQSILMTRDAFDTFVVSFADRNVLDKVRLLWFSLPVLGAIVGSICRVFLIYRLHILSKAWVPTLLAVALAMLATVAAFWTGVQFAEAGTLRHVYRDKNYLLVGIWNGSSAACDVFIAACTVCYLLRQKANFKRTHARIMSLIVVIIETGIFAATISTLNFLLFICRKHTSYFAISAVIVVKLYSNTMLLALNNRINIIGGRNEQETRSDHFFGTLELSQGESVDHPKGKNPCQGNLGARGNSTDTDQLGFSHNLDSGIARPANIFNQM